MSSIRTFGEPTDLTARRPEVDTLAVAPQSPRTRQRAILDILTHPREKHPASTLAPGVRSVLGVATDVINSRLLRMQLGGYDFNPVYALVNSCKSGKAPKGLPQVHWGRLGLAARGSDYLRSQPPAHWFYNPRNG